MKRILIFLVAVAAMLTCRTPTYGAMTYDQAYYRSNTSYLGSGGSNDPLYNLFGTVEGLYEGTEEFDAIRIIESTGATYYTKLQGGDQAGDLTLTLPTAYAGTTGFVLSSTTGGVLSWVANGGTFAGGSITSDCTLSNGVDIMSSTTTAQSATIKVYDNNTGPGYTNVLSWTNGDVPAIAMGSDTSTFALNSTTIDIAAGAVTGVTDLTVAGTVSLNDSATTNTTSIGGGTTTGTITIGGTGTQSINVGNAAGVKTVALGSTNTTSTTNVSSGSGGVNVNASNSQPVSIGTGTSTGTVAIGTGDTAQTVTIANGAGAKTVTLGSTNTTSTTTINSGSNGVNVNVNNSQPTNINTGTSAGATAIGGGSGTVAINSSDWDISTGGNITNIGSIGMDGLLTGTLGLTISGAAVSLNDSSNFNTSINGGTSTGTVTIGGTGAMTINIGQAGTGAKTIAIGDGTGAGSVTVYSGTGDLRLKSTDDIYIGQDSVAQDITIGNETGASSLTLKAGSGNIAIDGVAATTITVGDAAQEGTIKVGESSAAMNLSLGTGTGAHAIHIGDGGTAAQVVDIGSTSDASSLSLLAGTGNIDMQGVAATTITIGKSDQTGTMKFGESSGVGQVDLGTGTGARTVNIGTGGTGAKAISIGDGAAAGSIVLYSGTGDVNVASTDDLLLGARAVAQDITVGNETGATSLSLKAGTGNINVQGVAATTITIGDAAQEGAIKLGESSAGLTLSLATGNGAKVVNVANGTGIDQIVLGGGGTAADNLDICDEDTQANTIDIGGTLSTVTIGGATVNIAQPAVASLVTLGNETGASSLHLLAGTGNIDIQGVAATTVTVGDAAQTGTMKFGESSATVQVDIGTGTGAHTMNIGNGAGAQAVNVGSNTTTSATTILSGTTAGALSLNATAGGAVTNIGTGTTTGTVTIGGTGTQAIAVGNGAGIKTVTLGSATDASATTVQSGTGDLSITSTDDMTMTASGAVGLFSNAVEQTVTLGNETAASSLALKAGTGNITMASTGGISASGALEMSIAGMTTQQIAVEGTANAFEARLKFTDPTADVNFVFPVAAEADYAVMTSTLATNAANIANSVWGGTNQLIFEGATADAYETAVAVIDPNADVTITLPDKTGAVPVVIKQAYGATLGSVYTTDATDVNESSISCPDEWFDPNSELIYELAGVKTGANGTMSVYLYLDDGIECTLTSGGNTAGDWYAKITVHEHTNNANQFITGYLVTADGVKTDVDTDTTNFADGAATTVKIQLDLSHADDSNVCNFVKVSCVKGPPDS